MHRLRLDLVIVAVALSGCAIRGTCPAGVQASVHDALYLGTGKPSGGVVTAEEWNAFLATIVTPRFPDGLTVSEVSGQWRGADGTIVREATHVLQFVRPDDEAGNANVAAIAQAYKAQFQQEAVLRVSHRVCTSLTT